MLLANLGLTKYIISSFTIAVIDSIPAFGPISDERRQDSAGGVYRAVYRMAVRYILYTFITRKTL